jgi:hypothetical protein
MSFDYDGISIYNFQRNASASSPDKPRFLITPVSSGAHSSLELLGVRNSSVFLVNATIWVEGITDRRYMRKFLELYRKHCETPPHIDPAVDISRLEEDIHYAFVEYAGSNLKHWSFASAEDTEPKEGDQNDSLIELRTLCGRAFLIRDDDGTSKGEGTEAKRAQNKQLSELLEERFMLTPGREIENLLPASVIQAVVREMDPRADFTNFTRKEYRDQPLGKFLGERTRNPDKWGEKGTLKPKLAFCEKAIKQVSKLGITFSDLDDEVQTMVKQLCRFLVKQNQLTVPTERPWLFAG